MRYIKADQVLPEEVIELIQQYVDGQNIYIPRKAEHKRAWGQGTGYREELRSRNAQLRWAFETGKTVPELAQQFSLSEKSVHRILRETK